jgi:hypothetical protein
MATTSTETTETTETGTPVSTLTSEDVAALRLCDTVRFYYHEGRTFLRAELSGGMMGMPRLYTKREQHLFDRTEDTYRDDREREILATSTVYGYTVDDAGRRWWDIEQNPRLSCYEPGVGGRSTGTWATLASLLKAGDRLALKWTADINEGITRDYDLHRDTLHLVITRGKRTLTFLVADRVSPEDSSRMIRRNARNI